MKEVIKKILFGSEPVSEYVTVTVQADILEKVLLLADGQSIDISDRQWLLCLDPVVFGVWFAKGEKIIPGNDGYVILFKDTVGGNIVARLKLAYFNTIVDEKGTVLLLKLVSTQSRHINFIRTRLLFQKFYKKPGQDFNKLRAYAAAYSYPRKVRVISFADGDHYNIFPMDLVGELPGSNRFVFGLRHTNVTLTRIIETKKMVASEVSYNYKDIIYQLGKHHGGAPIMTDLGFATIKSKQFGFPVPEWADSYKEINILQTLDLGSHMLLFGEVVNKEILTEEKENLFHIHFLHYLHQKKLGDAYYPRV